MLEQEFRGMLEAAGLGHLNETDVQFIEMRRAFFGGAAIAFNVMGQTADMEDEDEAIVLIESLSNEIEDFVTGYRDWETDRKSVV